MNEIFIKLIAGILVGLFILVFLLAAVASYVVFKSTETSERATEIQYIEKVDTLSEWQIFQMALIEVESEYNSSVISHCNARGILQLTKVYIDEVNRLHDTDYTEHDAHNDTIALDCFRAFNNKRNPTFDIDTAIRLHNPNAGVWYRKRIREKMREISRREEVRKLIISQ